MRCPTRLDVPSAARRGGRGAQGIYRHAPRGSGPDLTGLGMHHPAEYFPEAIMNPNRLIVDGPGYTGPDGLSTMPSYAEIMTIKQLADVVAYLKSLRTGEDMAHMHGANGHATSQSGPMHMK